ncbi:MAG: MBL fold metallo-hydrolase [Spirochaetaceae bacterium]|nr:MAG: MBL fold metallo-hydrolase [Spirochaetaceae bacterium]
MKIRFWGARGSIPTPGQSTVYYGGNTACIEICYGSNRRIIVDAGTGIKPLGDTIARNELGAGPVKARIFLSHTHWDHIMGFPFFTPIFIPGTELDIYSPVTYEDESIESVFGFQLSYRYFPIRQSELAARLVYHELKEETIELEDGMRVTTKFLNHPVLCLGYRFEFDGKVFCTCYDTEPFRNVFPEDPADPDYDEFAAEEGKAAAREENRKILRFHHGADAVVYDTQYTEQEYLKSRIGWGHTSYEYAIKACHNTAVKRLYFFHHDPARSDDELGALIEGYRNAIAGKSMLQIDAAREGLEIEL